VPSGLEKISHLVEAEAEPLCCLDHPHHGDGFRRIEPVPARAAVGLGQQAATLVVPQGLLIHPRRASNLSAAHSR
jgi:hypothetical protein